MDGLRVLLWGGADAAHAVRAMTALRPFQVLDGPLGAADLVGLRDGVLVELRGVGPAGLAVRFLDAEAAGRAWIAAHSFLWVITRWGRVEEAVLFGGGAEPLRFSDGRFRPMPRPR